MLDINYIKNNKEAVARAIEAKKLTSQVDLEKLIKLHDEYLEILRLVEIKRSLRNKLSEDISKVSAEERAKLIEEASVIKSEIQEKEKELSDLKEQFTQILLKIPNVIHESVPLGVDDSENVSIRKGNTLPEFSFQPRDHIEIGKILDLFEFDKAGDVSGPRTAYFKNEAVLLELALVTYVMNRLTNKEFIEKISKSVNNPSSKVFTPIIPPYFIKSSVMDRMARLHPIDERYFYPEDEMVLIGSAEHTLGPLHMDENLKKEDLPIRYIGFSPAFRREAGSYGKDVKGVFRLHHFDKAEMETFTSEENGLVEQDFIVAIQEQLVKDLGIPYQVVAICTGDMGNPDYRQYDIECWLPGQGKYRETHTSDYNTDYQSRRLNTTYTDSDAEGKRKYVHMNDATAFAIGRILIAILENNQREDGSVVVPEVLRTYTGFDMILPKVRS